MSTLVTRQITHLPTGASANTKHTMNGASLKPARHVVLEQHPEGIYIFRYSDDWCFSGDTWHANAEDALGQIEYEFNVTELKWEPISEKDLTELTNRK